MAKVPKIVKEELEKIPNVMHDFANAAIELAKSCTELSVDLQARIDELEIENE